MKKKFKVAMSRENISTSIDIVRTIVDLMIDGEMPAVDAVSNVVAARALEKYQDHIRAAFSRAGVDLNPGEVLTVDVLLRVIREKSGLEVDTLSAAGIYSAVDTQLTSQLSSRLGVELPTVMGGVDVIKTALINAAKDAVSSGRATGFISAALIKRIRTIKTLGIDGAKTEEERKKTTSRIYEKRKRRKNREVWD